MTPRPLLRRAASLPESFRVPLLAFLFAFLLAPLLASHPTAAQTQSQKKNVCPWITEGTAAATLSGPVVTAVHLEADPDHPLGTCTFTLQQSPTPSVLEIAVTTTPSEPACPANSLKLPAIGNEATFCRLDRSPTETRYVLTSRVRDLFFRTTLTLQRPAPQPDPKQQEAHQQQLERIAEQVAGNLF
jgi:hypothetical protein